MAYFSGPYLTDPPPLPQRQYGLFDVALGPLPFPVEAAQGAGVTYVPNTCEDDVFIIASQCPPITGTKTFSSIEAAITAEPFTLMTSYTCGSVGFSLSETEQRVRDRMTLREQRGVEKRIWQGSTGVLGTVTGLFANAVPLGAAACPAEAIEMLEQQLADAGVINGIIHARPGMTPYLANNHLIEKPRARLMVTPYGTPYSFGAGYSGVGPTGQAVDTTTEYMYATGAITIWGGDVFVSNAGWGLDRSTNQMNVIAERTFAAVIECGVWAVSVTRNCGVT